MPPRTLHSLIGATAAMMAFAPMPASGAVYDGCGLQCSVALARNIPGVLQLPLRDAVVLLLVLVLNSLALVAVVTIVAAGVLLILSGGNESHAAKAKQVIRYTLYGLLLILCARLIVGFFTSALPSALNS